MVSVDVGPREIGGQSRRLGTGRQLVEEAIEFVLGEGMAPTQVSPRGIYGRAIHHPRGAGVFRDALGRVLFDEAEDVLLDRTTLARRTLPQPAPDVVRHMNGEGRRLSWSRVLIAPYRQCITAWSPSATAIPRDLILAAGTDWPEVAARRARPPEVPDTPLGGRGHPGGDGGRVGTRHPRSVGAQIARGHAAVHQGRVALQGETSRPRSDSRVRQCRLDSRYSTAQRRRIGTIGQGPLPSRSQSLSCPDLC